MIFIDTSAWIAIEDKKDINHNRALEFREEILSSNIRLFTTNYVLDETYTLLLLDLGYSKTIKFKHKLDELIDSNLVIILHIMPDLEKTAWEIFERFNKDKTWSFTDCTSKVVMELFNIQKVFTFDRHFVQMGFLRQP